MEQTLKSARRIIITLPIDLGKEIVKVAKEKRRTVSEFLCEVFRQYQSQRNLLELAKEGQKAVKKKKLTQKA